MAGIVEAGFADSNIRPMILGNSLLPASSNSFPESVSESVIQYLASKYMEDEELVSLYQEAGASIEHKKFSRYHQQLLEKMFLELDLEAENYQQQQTVRMLRGSKQRSQLTELIYKRSGTPIADNAQIIELSKQNADKISNLSRVLASTSLYNIGNSPTENISEYVSIDGDYSKIDVPFLGVDFDADDSSMAFRAQSSRAFASHWADEQSNTSTLAGSYHREPITTGFRDYQFPSHKVEQSLQAAILQDNDRAWKANNTTGLTGLGPEERRLISNIEVPSLKQQETQRYIDDKNTQVQQWCARGNGISDPNEPRSRESIHQAQVENGGILLVDDAASIRDNRLLDGQVYFDIKGISPTEVDQELMSQPHTFSDPPVLPYMTVTTFQPSTANDAIQKWNSNADTFSVISRTATWGTRRRSEPSLMDYEAVADGSFLKKLSIKQERKGPNSNFVGRLADMVRKRSTSNLKRERSSSDLAREATNESAPKPNPLGGLKLSPRTSSFGESKNPTPSLNTAIAAIARPLAAVGIGQYARSGSISAKSPKSPFHLGLPSFVKRGRSKSKPTTSSHTSLVGSWRGHGGPSVPNLSSKSAIEPDTKHLSLTAEPLDQDDDEDEEDDQTDEGDMRVEAGPSELIIPTYEGFKDHIRQLNPYMDPEYNWLVNRIAHQQEIRYKNLLNLRVKHMQAIRNDSCTARPYCIALGGSATLYDEKGKSRDLSDRSAGGLQLVTEFSDDSNPGEGALSSETFPKGVPMPPTRYLPAQFECQLCFKAKKFQKPSDWTKHIYEDVQPFTCTHEKCREPKSFKRKADWVRHENERHRHLESWICQMDDCRHPFYRKDNFLQHLVREHKLPVPKQKTKAAMKKAQNTEPAWVILERCHQETTYMPQDEPCKFCGKALNSWKKLTVHLAKHMEHISLPVLRLVEQKNVDADTIISPVEQNMRPITPIPRTKLEDSSSYSMMDSVSPKIPMMPQFTAGLHPINQSRTYGSMNSDFSMYPTPTFNQPTDFSISQPFVKASPSVATYQAPNILGITDTTNFGFDTLSVAPMQNLQQAPMSRAQGSSSSYGKGKDEDQRLNLLYLNSITEFLMQGEPFERFKKHLRWFIHPPKTLSEAVECAEAGLISRLVTEEFDSVAREEYFWLHELLEIGYTKEEIAELLIEKAQDAPWICYDENKAISHNVFQGFHAPLCVHREFTSEQAPILDGASASVHLPGELDNTPIKLESLSAGENLIESSVDQGSVNSPSKAESLTDNVKQTIQQLCGLGGVCPTRQERHDWNGQVNFDGTTALVTYCISGSVASNHNFVSRICNALRSLCSAITTIQSCRLCCDSFTILKCCTKDETFGKSIELCRVNVSLASELLKYLEILESSTLINTSMLLDARYVALKILGTLGKVHPKQISVPLRANEETTINLCSLAVQLLCLGFLSYSQGHTGPLWPSFLETPLDHITLLGARKARSPSLHIIGSLKNLTCMGDMLQSSVLAFSLHNSDEVIELTETNEPLDLVSSAEDIIDTWGPGSFLIKPSEESMSKIYAISVGGGLIHSTTATNEKFHWCEGYNHEESFPITIDRRTKILIGAAVTCKDNCVVNENQRRRQCDGMLEMLGTSQNSWQIAERQVGFQGGQYMNLQFNQTWVKTPALSLKKIQLGLPDNQLLPFLQSSWGLQVSFCTSIARRVRLRELIADVLPAYVESLFPVPELWKSLRDDHEIIMNFKTGNIQEWLGNLPIKYQQTVSQFIRGILVLLEPTGIDKKGEIFTIAWIQKNEPLQCLKIRCEKESYWARILVDSQDCATFAYITSRCLETDSIKCRGPTAVWQRESALLETAVWPHEFSKEQILATGTQWALKHADLYSMGSLDSLMRVKVERVTPFKAPQLHVSLSKIPMSFRMRLDAKKKLLTRLQRLRERQGIDSQAEQVIILAGKM